LELLDFLGNNNFRYKKTGNQICNKHTNESNSSGDLKGKHIFRKVKQSHALQKHLLIFFSSSNHNKEKDQQKKDFSSQVLEIE
jgi:hypothetical protein